MEKLSDIDNFVKIELRKHPELKKDHFINYVQIEKDKVIELYNYFFDLFKLEIRERKMIDKINVVIKSMHKSLYEEKGE